MPDETRTHLPGGPTTAGHPGTPPASDGTVAQPVAPLRPPADPALPSVPGYELTEEVGAGGMGVVFRGRDVALNRDVAVKLLHPRYPAGSPAARRFVEEAQITGQLQHPGMRLPPPW